jgi:hypothetical protein
VQAQRQTAGSDSIFVQIYMDVHSGSQGYQKIIFFFLNKYVEFLC